MVGYELGGRSTFSKVKGQICWKDEGPIGGVAAWARDERTGDFVRVLEVFEEEFVQGEPQSWSSGNFDSVEDAKKFASKAYRYLNK